MEKKRKSDCESFPLTPEEQAKQWGSNLLKKPRKNPVSCANDIKSCTFPLQGEATVDFSFPGVQLFGKEELSVHKNEHCVYDCFLERKNGNVQEYCVIQIIFNASNKFFHVWERIDNTGYLIPRSGTNIVEQAVQYFEDAFFEKTKNLWSNKSSFVQHQDFFSLIPFEKRVELSNTEELRKREEERKRKEEMDAEYARQYRRHQEEHQRQAEERQRKADELKSRRAEAERQSAQNIEILLRKQQEVEELRLIEKRKLEQAAAQKAAAQKVAAGVSAKTLDQILPSALEFYKNASDCVDLVKKRELFTKSNSLYEQALVHSQKNDSGYVSLLHNLMKSNSKIIDCILSELGSVVVFPLSGIALAELVERFSKLMSHSIDAIRTFGNSRLKRENNWYTSLDDLITAYLPVLFTLPVGEADMVKFLEILFVPISKDFFEVTMLYKVKMMAIIIDSVEKSVEPGRTSLSLLNVVINRGLSLLRLISDRIKAVREFGVTYFKFQDLMKALKRVDYGIYKLQLLAQVHVSLTEPTLFTSLLIEVLKKSSENKSCRLFILDLYHFLPPERADSTRSDADIPETVSSRVLNDAVLVYHPDKNFGGDSFEKSQRKLCCNEIIKLINIQKEKLPLR